ncbi:glycerophosphodiester phosphodiesterase [Evansella cellulosilytica]|uniref:Glycerophosphoryl diester phosphodiesterase n=1 Tax=Evansella cellulosilytica (strain ATCC 21833 / DSM 2522 / FERM P-1141 / JCM 9156 / N-4) TaxID=649639 RepID=E6TZ69_EVAC2|nr:glycerophosphodiester phosphodiesterase [Evansella cellulosilytica]ADU28931.1 glycerophosphoryl diester phosphodiesterase [Evansella cellulosilytica DSM 2522]
MNTNTLIFAHRGAAGTHPENTMEAFKAAKLAGADGIEFDVQMTKDRVLVVIHDETVDRTTNGTGWVKDFTYDQLKQLDAGSWFDESFQKANIPTLEEVFKWAANTSLLLNVELKNGVVQYEGIEEAVIDLIKQYKLEDRTVISSFNHYSLVEVNRLDSKLETAILFMEGLYEPWNYAKNVGATGLHCFLPVAVPELLVGARANHVQVRPFTVNEEKHMYGLIRGQCDAIITDWPEKAVQVREAVKKEVN